MALSILEKEKHDGSIILTVKELKTKGKEILDSVSNIRTFK